jgi:hypothetical protein
VELGLDTPSFFELLVDDFEAAKPAKCKQKIKHHYTLTQL